MPRPLPLTQRETKDLHADWWSLRRTEDGTLATRALREDEPGGRFVERVVIKAQFLTADQERVQALALADARVNWGELAGQAQAGDREGLGATLKSVLSSQDKSTANLLRVMVVEVTDAQGNHYPADAEETYAGMPTADTSFIVGEINKLLTPLVQPTALDHEIAVHAGRPAEVVAEGHFRGGGEAALHRQSGQSHARTRAGAARA